MIPFGRRTRRADEWGSAHERARTRAAQRLDWPLDPAEAAWLDAHLASCPSCRRRAADYEENRDRLRTLRDVTPSPPRDLWARTAAAIELESRRGRRSPLGRAPVGALSGLLVIAVVLGATLLSNAPTPSIAPATDAAASFEVAVASASLAPGPVGTPLAVAAGPVQVVRKDQDGTFGYGTLGVDAVCPKKADVDCPMVPDASATALSLDADPDTIIGSPDDHHAVIVSKPDDSNGSTVIVVVLPGGSEAPATPAPETDQPTATPDTSASPPASQTPEGTPTTSETPSESGEPSEEPVTPSPEESEPPTPTPTPTPESIAIASGLVVVGQTAAYSPDGEWFAFTARPADGSHGPDIYVWHVGSEQAVPVTDDHQSVFASWAKGRLVGSRPTAGGDTVGGGESAGPLELPPMTFLIDPESGREEVLTGSGYRPIVSPDGRWALVFDGPVPVPEGSGDVVPGEGALKLRGWDAARGAAGDGGATVLDVSGTPFDARWDETGTSFAVWIRDGADQSFGRLSLFFVDSDTGEVVQPENAPREEPALPGFSIGEGRLAWATPAGQGGEGSRVRIVAWSDEGVGSAETAPGDQVVVIR